MKSPSDSRRSRVPLLIRVGLIVVLIVATIISISSGAATAMLRAVDFLAPQPGLSGLLLVFLAPFGFLLVLALGAWATAGMRRPRADKETP